MRAHADEYAYPLMIKPLHSHEFKRVHEGKYLMAADFDELLAACRRTHEHGVDVVLLEMIPGPDDLLCSYYTYLDENGAPQFHFTKRVIRRYPEHEGFGCYHITDWNPEVRDLGMRLFAHVGLRGVANVEFKRDPRDGRLKVIEVNARFTAANGLVAAAGYDLALFVYNRAAGLPQPSWDGRPYRVGLRLWYPLDDFLAYLDLRQPGAAWGSASGCAASRTPAVLPYFSLADPKPSVVRFKLKIEDAGRGQRAPHRRAVDGGWTVGPPSCTRGRWAAPSARRSWPAAGRWSAASRAAAHARRRRRGGGDRAGRHARGGRRRGGRRGLAGAAGGGRRDGSRVRAAVVAGRAGRRCSWTPTRCRRRPWPRCASPSRAPAATASTAPSSAAPRRSARGRPCI